MAPASLGSLPGAGADGLGPRPPGVEIARAVFHLRGEPTGHGEGAVTDTKRPANATELRQMCRDLFPHKRGLPDFLDTLSLNELQLAWKLLTIVRFTGWKHAAKGSEELNSFHTRPENQE